MWVDCLVLGRVCRRLLVDLVEERPVRLSLQLRDPRCGEGLAEHVCEVDVTEPGVALDVVGAAADVAEARGGVGPQQRPDQTLPVGSCLL